ncbi:MAG: helix-turn-helix transcriptional regulator [Breznakibacter sp.]
MEKTLIKQGNVHLGRNIARIRELKGIKQEALAVQLGVSQQMVSKIEQSENMEDEKLEEIAKVLGVTVKAIKEFSEEALVFHIQNMHDQSSAYSYNYNYQCSFNPIDKVVELYERLLASEREKVEILKRLSKS